MKLIVKEYDLDSSEPAVIIHDDDCIRLGVKVHDRVRINSGDVWVSLVGNSDTIVERGQILIPNIYLKCYNLKDGDEVDVAHSPKPDSVIYIRKKMDNKTLTKEEIYAVVNDILEAKLSNIEVSAWLTSLYINGMDLDEISHFTNAMVDTGDRIVFERQPVFDFHSVGGVPGNKVTPI
ncbi:MAG: thymidine phosphorylase, partial [Candidatus Methanomethylophilaceae archaeon]|nr:thymidine phosphorylase [Candidatus Methanomethylophilaceae archaeon]